MTDPTPQPIVRHVVHAHASHPDDDWDRLYVGRPGTDAPEHRARVTADGFGDQGGPAGSLMVWTAAAPTPGNPPRVYARVLRDWRDLDVDAAKQLVQLEPLGAGCVTFMLEPGWVQVDFYAASDDPDDFLRIKVEWRTRIRQGPPQHDWDRELTAMAGIRRQERQPIQVVNPPPAPPRWEYKVRAGVPINDLQGVLDGYGADGWQAVAVNLTSTSYGATTFHLVMSRPATAVQDAPAPQDAPPPAVRADGSVVGCYRCDTSVGPCKPHAEMHARRQEVTGG